MLYTDLAEKLTGILASGAISPGERFISVRVLAQREGVSMPTAVAALRVLEGLGLIVARPRSGYFVALQGGSGLAPTRIVPPSVPQDVSIEALALRLLSKREGIKVPFGAATPDAGWMPQAALTQALQRGARRLSTQAIGYSYPPGDLSLRTKLAHRFARGGTALGPEEIIITAGATQALSLALRAVCRPGDVIGVESPCYFGVLLLAQQLGLSVIEILTDPVTGLDVASLAESCARHRLSAVVASPRAQNPTGAVMPPQRRAELVALLEAAQIPLIEDDLYGDIQGGEAPNLPCKAFDRSGLILHIGSISKTLAPGWRVGWIAPGQFYDRVLSLRYQDSLGGSRLLETALADFMTDGGYDRHISRFRARISRSMEAIVARARGSFPPGTRLQIPPSGYLLWVELPSTVSALDVADRLSHENISVSPGALFSPSGGFGHFLRLNCAIEPSASVLAALDRIGAICTQQAQMGRERLL